MRRPRGLDHGASGQCVKQEVLLSFNMAPLCSRRDISMLGLIQRSVTGRGPAHFSAFFQRRGGSTARATRATHTAHSRQLVDVRRPAYSEQVRRSAVGLIPVYNLLPEQVVSLPEVSAFQGDLQSMLKSAAAADCPSWWMLLSPRIPMYMHPLRVLSR